MYIIWTSGLNVLSECVAKWIYTLYTGHVFMEVESNHEGPFFSASSWEARNKEEYKMIWKAEAVLDIRIFVISLKSWRKMTFNLESTFAFFVYMCVRPSIQVQRSNKDILGHERTPKYIQERAVKGCAGKTAGQSWKGGRGKRQGRGALLLVT